MHTLADREERLCGHRWPCRCRATRTRLRPVDIRVSLGDGECTLEVGSRGDAINAESIGHRRDTLRTGGRGLLVIAALVDTMALPPAPPGQVLIRITKHLPDGTAAPNR